LAVKPVGTAISCSCSRLRLVVLLAAFVLPGPSSHGLSARAAASLCASAIDVIGAKTLSRVALRLRSRSTITILALGSSSTSGVGATSINQAYPERLQVVLAAAWPGVPVHIVNKGVGGDITAMMLERLRETLKSVRVDLVIWQVGSNDALQTKDEAELEKAITAGLDEIARSGSDAVLLDPQFVPSWKDMAGWQRYVAIVRKVGETNRVPVLARYRWMKKLYDEDPETLKKLLSPDWVHMNDDGYDCLAMKIGQSIRRLADKARPSQ
jgi:acyl-CoA thioesterase-1